MFRFRKTLIYFSILSILVATLGIAASPALAGSCTQYHTVQKGEYLVQIGRFYGVDWRYIAQINGIYYPWTIYPGQQLCIKLSGDGQPPPPPPPPAPSRLHHDILYRKGYGDNSVTIQTTTYRPMTSSLSHMGPMGPRSQRLRGRKTESGKGGTHEFTYSIPSQLHGYYQIAIRMQSPKSGYYAYNWFYNNTSGGGGQPPPPPPPPPPPGYTGVPTFNILSVHRDKDVTVQAYNLPPNDTMVVTMGPMGTKGINGIQVARSNQGGNKQFTFCHPPALYSSYKIAVRMQIQDRLLAYNWFITTHRSQTSLW
jgi:LysM repeat protein